MLVFWPRGTGSNVDIVDLSIKWIFFLCYRSDSGVESVENTHGRLILLWVKLHRRNCSKTLDSCASPNLQVIVTEAFIVPAFFKLLIITGYTPSPRNCNYVRLAELQYKTERVGVLRDLSKRTYAWAGVCVRDLLVTLAIMCARKVEQPVIIFIYVCDCAWV